MQKKIIFLDLDGNLIEKKNKVSKESKKIINKLKESDIKIILISGRPFCATIPIYKRLGLTSLMVSDTGAYISNPSDNNFVPIRKVIYYNLFISFYKSIKNYIETALYNIDEQVFINNNSTKLDYFSFTKDKTKISRGDFTLFRESPSGFLILVFPTKDKDFKEVLSNYEMLSARYWGVFNNNFLYEVYLSCNNKGVAAKQVLDYYKLNKNQALAFGDGINDIELFQTVPGIAMKNGAPELKKYALDITRDSNKLNGFAKYIKKYLSLQ